LVVVVGGWWFVEVNRSEAVMSKGLLVATLFSTVLFGQAQELSWLDRPLANWNAPVSSLQQATPKNETVAETAKRCTLPLLQSTPGERALADAGWLPFHMFDRQILRRDVEIIAGLTGADGMCRPVGFNVFVFVNGRLAGTLSPGAMASRTDSSIAGGLRLGADDVITAEFSRFTSDDPLCCPSRRVTVAYRIDRTATPPVVVPVSVRTTRQ
jgi:LppP/LprE lipoprotein